METRKMIYAWEQFKEAASEAAKLYKDNGKSFVVYIPALDIFQATDKPQPANAKSGAPADKIIVTFDDPLNDPYSFQSISTDEMIAAFEAWANQIGRE